MLVHRMLPFQSAKNESSNGDEERSAEQARPRTAPAPFSSLYSPLKRPAKRFCGKGARCFSHAAEAVALAEGPCKSQKRRGFHAGTAPSSPGRGLWHPRAGPKQARRPVCSPPLGSTV